MNPAENHVAPQVVGAGLITLDLIVGDLHSHRFWHQAGGTCGNVLSILTHLGHRTAAVARIGQDRAGDILTKRLAAVGVDCRYVRKDQQVATSRIVEIIREGKVPTHRFLFKCPLCKRRLPRNGSPTLELARQSSAGLGKPVVFFFDRAADSILLMAREARKAAALVVFEPAKIGGSDEFAEALRCSDVVKYSGQRLRASLDALLSPGVNTPRLVVETLGSRGLRYRSLNPDGVFGDWLHQEPVKTATIVDTAGAGDWCTAGFLTKLLAHDPCTRWEPASVDSALAYGQALAAASAAFEGPLGYLEAVSSAEIKAIAERTLASDSVPALVEFQRGTGSRRHDGPAGEQPLCPLCLQVVKPAGPD